MNDGNYIKLNRSILDWGWYTDINTFRLFVHMLLKANWKAGMFQAIPVPRGSFVSSYPRLSEETRLTINEIRTALKHLTLTEEVTVKSHAKYSVFTINNYNRYQDINTQITDISHADDSQNTDKAHSINSLLTTIEEGKKERREYIKDIVDLASNEVSAKNERKTFEQDSFEMKCVDKMIDSCLALYPNSKVPTTDESKHKWAIEIERMKRLDARSEEDIMQALDFAVKDSFWRSNIRSTKKLREKFEMLIIKSRDEKRKENQKQAKNQFNNFQQREYGKQEMKSMEEQLLQK